MDLTEEQIERYSRHIILADVGPEGQEAIMNGKVLIIGAGGLGSPAALYLAAAGVGTLGLIDDDMVNMTNLQRQIIHATHDLDKAKVLSAKQKIEKLNPDVNIVTYQERINSGNINEIIEGYNFIIDGTDNFPTKFLINDACVLAHKPFSHGGVLRFDGQTMTFSPGNACYRCVFRSPPPKNAVPSCSQAGILGSIVGMLGTIQATEAIKYLIGKGNLLTNRLLIFDAYNMDFRTVMVKRSIDCPICGENPSIKELVEEEQPVCDLK